MVHLGELSRAAVRGSKLERLVDAGTALARKALHQEEQREEEEDGSRPARATIAIAKAISTGARHTSIR